VRVRYEGVPVGLYRLDLVVCSKVVVEIKAAEAIDSKHLATTFAYLKATSLQVGLVINFSDCVMRSRRVFREASGVKEEEKIGRRERQDFLGGKAAIE
jgi:GxxExxY protein